MVDSPPVPEREPEEHLGFDFSAWEDEEEATASDGQLNQAAAHAYGHSANIDLEEDDGRGEAREFSYIEEANLFQGQYCSFGFKFKNCLCLAFWAQLQLGKFCWLWAPR